MSASPRPELHLGSATAERTEQRIERVGNQGRFTSNPRPQQWQGLTFGTASELAVAQAFDQLGVLYLPGAAARVTDMDAQRRTREIDFLVVEGGRVGILELDGWPHNGRAADDHRRDRAYRRSGIWVIERISSAEALRDPAGVARAFRSEMRHYRRTA